MGRILLRLFNSTVEGFFRTSFAKKDRVKDLQGFHQVVRGAESLRAVGEVDCVASGPELLLACALSAAASAHCSNGRPSKSNPCECVVADPPI
jgi:hypothetical protein